VQEIGSPVITRKLWTVRGVRAYRARPMLAALTSERSRTATPRHRTTVSGM
jgi:hypothetical protein